MKLWIFSSPLCLLAFLGFAEGLDLFPLPSLPKRCATPNCIGLNCVTKPGSDGCPVCVCDSSNNCPEIVCDEGCFLEAPPPSGKCPGCVCTVRENPLSSLSNDQLETAQSNLLQALQRNVSSLAQSVAELRQRVNAQEHELQQQRKSLHRLRDIHKHAHGRHHHHHHQHGNNTEGLLGRTHHLHDEHHSENNTGNGTEHHHGNHHPHHHRHHGPHHHVGHDSENTTNHDSHHHHDGHHHHDHVGNITGRLGHLHHNNLTDTLHSHHDEGHHHDKHDGEHHNHHEGSEENNSHENSAEDHHAHHDDHNEHHAHHDDHNEHHDHHQEHHDDHHQNHHDDHHHDHHDHHGDHHDHHDHHGDHHYHHHHHDQGLHIPQLSETEYDFATCEVQPNTALPAEQQQNVRGRINLWQQKGGKTLHVHVRLQGFNVAGHAHEGHEDHENSKEAEDAPKVAAASPLSNLGKHVRQGFQSLASNAQQGFPKAEPGLPDSHEGHHHHHLQNAQESVQERLLQAPKQLPASGNISSLHPPGEGHVHGFHVHTNGDLSDGCQTTGPHFNPTEKNHGGRNSSVRHVGDFGNIPCDSLGVTNVIFTDETASLTGEQSIVGRSLVIHANQDDLGTNADDPESLATGNSGPRIACCVIERVNRLPHFRTARRILREIMHPFSAIESE